ncbi:hypothetical protein EVAR_27695_1 [Eumeta japonica]|uniref:Uncharacterized protein n=1 Tax=Eumeta variegata TaxID=151549 RepID=A0A4C1WP35_EUMVA|nr:hypothetical protein EVAR_27695_1 [Eumeta japonica]
MAGDETQPRRPAPPPPPAAPVLSQSNFKVSPEPGPILDCGSKPVPNFGSHSALDIGTLDSVHSLDFNCNYVTGYSSDLIKVGGS